MRPKVKRILIVGGAVVAVLVLAGVAYSLGITSAAQPTASVNTSTGGAVPETARDEFAVGQSAGMSYGSKVAPVAPAPSADGSADLATPSESLIIRTGNVSIRVESLDNALAKVRSLVSANKAEITDLSVDQGPDQGPIPLQEDARSDYPANATITIRVPADSLEKLKADLARVGTVTSESSSSSDVTEQHVDLSARLKNLQAQEAQLRSFFARASKVSDLLAVEQELSRVRGEIEAMQAQIEYLERQAARATLTVTLSEPGPVVSPAGPTWGVSEAITNGLRGAMAIVNGTITVVIAIAPFLVIVAIVWVVVRSIMRRRSVHASQDADESDAR